jgi:hypothetical protein
MRNSRRNIPDPVSPQNPLNKTDITPDRIQDHLEDKTPVEDILREPDKKKDEPLSGEQVRKQTDVERSVQDDAGL